VQLVGIDTGHLLHSWHIFNIRSGSPGLLWSAGDGGRVPLVPLVTTSGSIDILIYTVLSSRLDPQTKAAELADLRHTPQHFVSLQVRCFMRHAGMPSEPSGQKCSTAHMLLYPSPAVPPPCLTYHLSYHLKQACKASTPRQSLGAANITTFCARVGALLQLASRGMGGSCSTVRSHIYTSPA
jgi:hypothetical protein